MTEPERVRAKGPNWTTLGLIAGLVLVVVLVAYFATGRNADQDKLTGGNMSSTSAAKDPEKLCASKPTYELVKRELFRRAAQLRGSDQGPFDKLSAYASLRMENPVMESQDDKTGAVNCSASTSLDLPPGVQVVGGRRTLSTDLDYVVQQAADGSGLVVMLRNADPIISPLATLAKTGQPASAPNIANPAQDDLAPLDNGDQAAAPRPATPPLTAPTPAPAPVVRTPTPAPVPAPAVRPAGVRPSFSCAKARTRGEIAVCSDAGLASLDRNMASQYVRAMGSASPEQQALLRRTRDRFLSYRDRCPNNSCIGDAYTGRMREIRDIMQGR